MTSSSTISTAQRADGEVPEEVAVVVPGFVVVVTPPVPPAVVLVLVAALPPPGGLLGVEVLAGCEAGTLEPSAPPQADNERNIAHQAALQTINRIQHIQMNDVVGLAAAL
jgi:hypothetical protein